MSFQLFLSMAAFALASSISPGPVNVVSVTLGVKHGFRAAMRHVSGATIGFTLLLLIIGLGVNALLWRFPALTNGIKWAGVAFLLYMAVQLARDDGNISESKHTRQSSYWHGALMQWLNPKAWLASIAGMGAYAGNGETRLVLQFTLIYFVVCYASLGVWAYAGAYLKRYLQNPRHMRWFNRTMSALLVLSCVYLIVAD